MWRQGQVGENSGERCWLYSPCLVTLTVHRHTWTSCTEWAELDACQGVVFPSGGRFSGIYLLPLF